QALGRRIGAATLDAVPSPAAGSVTDPLAWLGRACADDASESDVAGRAALVERGTCTFKEKYERAVEEGATAVVIYNDRPGPFGGGGGEDHGGPPAAAPDTDGAARPTPVDNGTR